MKRVVLDEGVPRQLASALARTGIEAERFRDIWKGSPDGAVLDFAEALGFDVLVTSDQSLIHQQPLPTRSISLLTLPTNRRTLILARVDDIADTIRRLGPAEHVAIMTNGQHFVTRHGGGRRTTMPPLAPFNL